MGAITNVQCTGSARGNSGWTSQNVLGLGGSSDYKGRLTFPALSAGKPITELQLQMYRDSSGNLATLALYATTSASLVGNDIASAAYLETIGMPSGTGMKSFSLGSNARDVISQFAGTWYLLVDADISIEIRGSAASNSARFNGAYSEGSIRINDGGVWKLADPCVNDNGVWKVAVAYINESGVWKQGV